MYSVDICGTCKHERLYSWDEPCKSCKDLKPEKKETFYEEARNDGKDIQKSRKKSKD